MGAESDQKKPEAQMLWGGRFKDGLDPLMNTFNSFIHIDSGLWKEDIEGSVAWARANKNAGILTESEFAEIERGLGIVAEEWETKSFSIKLSDEDIYTANERRLCEIIGTAIGGKLHTGRSRNDQSATDQRLWTRKRLEILSGWLKDVIRTIASRAEREIDQLMPGYTHLQRAQTVRWSHWLASYGFALASDLDSLEHLIRRVNVCPYGNGAIAGNAFGVDRDAIAKELGFGSTTWNSMRSVGDREYTLETLQWASTVMLHLSRLSEDLINYSSSEFGFVTIADAYCTGSSLMPQKKNADSLELIRGRTGEVFGLVMGVYVAIKGLPSTYNKDLQGSLKALFAGVQIVGGSIRIAGGVLSTLTVNSERMNAALTPDLLATDLADYLVRKGVPFRETHHVAGRVVAKGEELHVPINALSFEQLKGIDGRFQEDVLECFDYLKSVESKSGRGSTCKASVLEQIQELRRIVGDT
ncbi:argininosuccinate lyase [Xylariomycetidae sp. FL2044]|nr:argininosuccinate lyase [Xylariomycetidae sp. FL2044]